MLLQNSKWKISRITARESCRILHKIGLIYRRRSSNKISLIQSVGLLNRGGVEDTRLEAKAKAKDTKKIRGQGQGQGQPFRGQNLSRPRTGMLEAKAKDQGHRRKCSPKKKSSKIFFRRSPIRWRTQNLLG